MRGVISECRDHGQVRGEHIQWALGYRLTSSSGLRLWGQVPPVGARVLRNQRSAAGSGYGGQVLPADSCYRGAIGAGVASGRSGTM